ncbi:MAG: SlyX family protein [Simplicispira sp.]|nr:SlyX family protein [Simplicispira sp.]
MDFTHDTERRLTELEIKASYSEDLLEQLNLLVYRQQQHIDALLQELQRLRQNLPEAGSNTPRNLRDELPPHY